MRPSALILSSIVDCLQGLAFPFQVSERNQLEQDSFSTVSRRVLSTLYIGLCVCMQIMLRSDVSVQTPGALNAIQSSLLSWLSFSKAAVIALGSDVLLAILVVALVWTAGYVALVGLVGWRFSRQQQQNGTTLKILRSVAMGSSTVLFLPTSSVLIQALTCKEGRWSTDSSVQCWSGAHAAVSSLILILFPVFVGLSLFIAAVFFERDARSQSMSAQVHGTWHARDLLVDGQRAGQYSVS